MIIYKFAFLAQTSHMNSYILGPITYSPSLFGCLASISNVVCPKQTSSHPIIKTKQTASQLQEMSTPSFKLFKPTISDLFLIPLLLPHPLSISEQPISSTFKIDPKIMEFLVGGNLILVNFQSDMRLKSLHCEIMLNKSRHHPSKRI